MNKLILFLLLLFPVESFAATYYVAKTGNNSNPGTTGSPKLTISGASGGLSLLASGDTLIIRAGTYTDVLPQASIPAGGGSFATATTIKAETAGTVTLTGGGTGIAHYSTNQSYIIWDGFIFDVVTNFNVGNGAHHIRITNFELKNSVDNGFIFESSSGSNELINGIIHDTGSNPSGPPHGIYSGSANNLFENLEIYNSLTGFGIHLYDGGNLNVNNNIIRNCKVHNNKRMGILVSDGANNKIYNNFVYDNGQHGIQMWHNTDNALIANNTVVHNGSDGGGYGIYVVFSDTDNVSIINNISWQNISGSILNDGTGGTRSMNLCSDATQPGCINPVVGNLNFVTANTNLHLQTSSTAAIDKVTTNLPTSFFTTDIDGTTRTSPWDIGADEVAASGTPIITLNQPVAGASWTIGSQQTITWTAANTGANVIIEMDRDNNASYETSIVASTPTANGSYTWTVTGAATSGNTAKVRVKDTGAATNSISGLFAISAAAGGGLTKRISDNSGSDIPGVDDAYMYSPSPTVNTGSEDGIFVSKNDATTTHNSGLIRFTGLSQIPSTATVTSVTLGLYLQYTGTGAASQTVQLRRLLRSWNEMQATWSNYNTTTAWGTAGALGAADRDSTVLASLTVSTQTPAYYTVTDTGTLKTFVQNIVSGSAANEGLHLEDSSTGDDVGGFTSSDGTNTQRPYLDVTYTVGTSTITVTEPKAGDLFLAGQTGPARWTSQGISGLVNIELSRDNGTTWGAATLFNGNPATNLPYDSSDIALVYDAPTSSTCKIRVVSVNDAAILGTSGGNFRIGGTRAGFTIAP